MCLTIPKKVVEIDGNKIVVELANGDRQSVKSIVALEIGDFCLTQQNVAIERIDADYAGELIEILKGGKANV
ncbi:MAG: HypC/HybG/HupF family hydrogenase formation chaperone [Candidatus Moranbacteria bacterium]|nr:HypC/HybG/HupF family hydrogenase formation chaperone [Candidatus Moranbacteria bacterium]